MPTRAGSMVAVERGPGLGTKSTGRGRSRGRKLGCADQLNWEDSATCMYENCSRKAGSSTSLQNTGSRGWLRSRFVLCGGGRIPPALRAAAKAVAKAVAPGPRRVSDGGDVGPGTACALCGGGCAGGVGEEAAGSARVGVGGGVGVVPTRAGSMVAAERGPGLGTRSTGRGRSRGRKAPPEAGMCGPIKLG